MRILMMAPEFPPMIGGIGTRSYESAKNLSRLGERLTVLTMALRTDSNQTDPQHFNVISISWLSRMVGHGVIGFIIKVLMFFLYGVFIVRARKIDLI